MTPPQVNQSPVLVLVADDEASIAAVVAEIVHDLGHEVRIAVHGKHALELARSAWPALVITDLMMPQVDGAALIVALRAEAAAHGYRFVPVILMTAAGARYAQSVGADAVLEKPFDLEELERLIVHLLGRAETSPPGSNGR